MVEIAAAAPVRRFQFGPFTVDVVAGELRKHGARVKLQERPFQLLVALLERPGTVVTREDIRKRLWPDGTFVDFDHSISSAINRVRSALSDPASQPRYIETVGRRGYRFVYPISAHAEGPLAAAMHVEPTRARATGARRLLRIASLVVPAAFVAVAAVALVLRSPGPSVDTGLIRAIVVLPLKNLSSDPEQEYFSEGLTDELITSLGSLDGLRVISRTSAMQYKDSRKPLRAIARELDVDAVVEGSVLRSDGGVRITVRLVEAATDHHVWGKSYECDHRDILDLQNEVTRDIAENIELSLTSALRQRLTASRPIDPQAHEAYLHGRSYWSRRRPADLKTAILYYEKAIAREPEYARAYAGLADSYSVLRAYNLAPQDESIRQARAAAVKAVELDESLAEAHASLGLIALIYDWDWKTAEREYRRAIQLDSNYATAHHWYAQLLAYRGRFDEAFAEIETARQLDPLSLIIATDRGEILYLARDYDRAIAQVDEVLDIEPNFLPAHYTLIFSLAQKGFFSAALTDIEKWRGSDDTAWSMMLQAYLYGLSGQRVHGRNALGRLEQLRRRRPMDPAPVLLAHVGLGNKEEAFSLLEEAYTARSTALTSLGVNPIYDPLREDPRFQLLMRRIGLAP
jgi:TolB-like protein/DNA-binding winged helix-turn-helix (wHTH) protein/tetratricopeptide (TPR) repeat protein